VPLLRGFSKVDEGGEIAIPSNIREKYRVREYQQLLPFYNKKRARFEELKKYLVSPVKV